MERTQHTGLILYRKEAVARRIPKAGVYKMEKEHICYIHKSIRITEEEFKSINKDLLNKHQKIKEFIGRDRKDAKLIPEEELVNHDIAFFQLLQMPPAEQIYFSDSLSNIMVDFLVDREKGEVTAKKWWRFRGEVGMETRIYLLENYNKTWRAWTAVPEKKGFML